MKLAVQARLAELDLRRAVDGGDESPATQRSRRVVGSLCHAGRRQALTRWSEAFARDRSQRGADAAP